MSARLLRRLRRPSLLLGVMLCTMLASMPAFGTNVGTNVSPDTSGYGTLSGNVYFAYVQEGEWIQAWGNGGTAQLYGPDEATYSGSAWNTTVSTPRQVTAEEEGVWTFAVGGSSAWALSVYDGDPQLTPGEDPRTQTVAAGVEEITGRVWAENYAISQPGGGGGLKTLDFWMLNDSGYQYALRLRNYNGIQSSILANSLGIPAGSSGVLECTPSYQSADTPGATAEPPPMECADPYRLFFEEPAADLPVSAAIRATEHNDNRTTQVIKPPPVNPNSLSVSGFSFTPSAPGQSSAGRFDYNLGSSFFGGHLLQIDVDGNGAYDDAVDREVRVGAAGAPLSYDFDGLDGEGDPIEPCTPMNARVYLDRVGEVHVVQADVEGRSIEIVRENGPGAPDATIYWDDTETSSRSNEILPPYTADGTAGHDSTGGVHGWDYGTNSWGNEKYIDDWSFVPADRAAGTLEIPGRCLEVAKTSDAGDSVREGDTVTYTVTAENTGDEDYTASNPARVVDDLSEVLDDAELTGTATATVDGEPVTAPTFSSPRLTWEGPLAAGESVEISYTVTVTGEGDRTGRNIAFAPNGDDPDADTPECEDVANGRDEATGLPCDTTTFEMPRLAVEKTADLDTLPSAGEVVTYTVTATNTGNGPFTPGDPAHVVDDLSDVLDDADFVDGSLEANLPGSLTRDGNRIVWTGPLASQQAVIITYQVEYTAAGDAQLNNVAFGPENPDDEKPVCDPRDADGLDPTTGMPCDRYNLPGAKLAISKSVDPASGTAVEAGDELTYTLRFTNNGSAPAAIDHTDHVAGLLDDATVSAPASDDGLTVSAISGGTFTVTGSVPAGESYEVQYTATVLPFDEQGDHLLENFLVETGSQPPAECVPGSELCTVNHAPLLEVEKSADPASGTSVQSGDEVGYTLTFRNVGAGVAVVDQIDDLSGVLDDATLTSGPTADELSAIVADETLEITGAVAAGSPQTVQYTVTVRPDGEHGDNVLSNYVFESGSTPPASCETDDPTCTSHPVGELELIKSVNPDSGSMVDPGDLLQYSLSFHNIGTGDYDVAVEDDMSRVLDDAALVDAPSAQDAILDASDVQNGRFAVEGTLSAGDSDVIDYSVRVLPDGERGDDALGNWVVEPGEDPPSGPCVPTADALCTSNLVTGTVAVTKSSDPADGETVEAGDRITYTLTFENTGRNAGAVDFVDHLSHVLDDARLVSGPSTAQSSITASRSGDTIHVSGELDGGETATVTYVVQVRADDDRGDDDLLNVVTVNGDVPDFTCDDDSPLCTSHPVESAEEAGILPSAGGPAIWWLTAGLGLVAVGVAVRWRNESPMAAMT